MPKNNVDNLITDQEIAFDRLVLSGTMTDRQAAEAVGLNPDTASHTKSKPRVRAWMLEHRAAVQQLLVQQDAQLKGPLFNRQEPLWPAADLPRRLENPAPGCLPLKAPKTSNFIELYETRVFNDSPAPMRELSPIELIDRKCRRFPQAQKDRVPHPSRSLRRVGQAECAG